MFEKMLYCIPPENHGEEKLRECLAAHPEIKFVSLAGVDIFGNDTDEKIPVRVMLKDLQGFLHDGVQTDGSSVSLPLIADLSNAKVNLLPDTEVNWYVDYNLHNIDEATGLCVGTLRIPAFLVHNDSKDVGSRVILRDSVKVFETELLEALKAHPYVFEYLPFDSADDIESLMLTNATEMEFYVKTPHEQADKERLHTSQELKEQYWKRTVGPVRTALENTLDLLDRYGFSVEMGHKEVGGVKPELMRGGDFEHIMEQLEIDWKYAGPLQAADNDYQVRYIIKDVFRKHGLDVTFMAKPVEGAAGSGKHTHFGLSAKLKDGRVVSLFSPLDPDKDYINPLGYGALMGILKNYEIINPLANCTNDSMNRLKPGYEAPVSIVTSLGQSVDVTSRNRTVLVGLIRDKRNPLSTRFELRSPNPKSNTYMVISAGVMAMLDGILAVLGAEKTPEELEKEISKAYGEEGFYLEKDRMYRAENNIYADYDAQERSRLFGKSPATVWENLNAFKLYPEKAAVLLRGNAMEDIDIKSFVAAAEDNWITELQSRIIPGDREAVAACVKLHGSSDAERENNCWKKIEELRCEIARDGKDKPSLLTQLHNALSEGRLEEASGLQAYIKTRIDKLDRIYTDYKDNLSI